jgi:hypothetical protein
MTSAPCPGADQGVDNTLGEAPEPGVDVAPDLDGPQIGPDGGDLRRAPRAPGADPGSRRKLEKGRWRPRDQHVTGVRPGEERCQAEPRGRQCRKVLRRMDGEVGAAIEERLLELLHEDTLARRVTEPHRWMTIAMGGQRHEHELVLRVAARKRVRRQLRLDDRERAPARRQPKPHSRPT